VPKYTKMAIHRAIPVYSHFSILGHRARHKLISGEGAQPPSQTPPPRLATSLDTDLKLFSGEGAQPPLQTPPHYLLYSALCCSIRNVYTQDQASPVCV